MDINDGIWNGAKHLWEIFVAAVSALFSYILYRSKKPKDQSLADRCLLYEHDTSLQIFEERFKNLEADIIEIKDYLKKILFKL